MGHAPQEIGQGQFGGELAEVGSGGAGPGRQLSCGPVGERGGSVAGLHVQVAIDGLAGLQLHLVERDDRLEGGLAHGFLEPLQGFQAQEPLVWGPDGPLLVDDGGVSTLDCGDQGTPPRV